MKKLATVLCILTICVFMLLFVQERTHFIQLKPLAGVPAQSDHKKLSLHNLSDGSFQDDLEQRLRYSFGFNEFLVRNYNQVLYSCLHSVTNRHIRKGLDGELYLKMYLEEVTGKTLRNTYSSIDSAKALARYNVEETMRLVDTLRSHGTEFLFVFAPTKTYVYSEKMPSYYRKHIQEFSLEDYYIELFKEYGIPHIDFYHQFRAMRDTVAYPLYTKTGTHWATSTLPYVTDSIYKKITSLTGKQLPKICCANAPLSTEYTEQDGELESKMNLLFPLDKPALPRPEIVLCDTAGKDRPNLLVVGDSHFGSLLAFGFTDAFANWDFWEYNKTSISSNPTYKWVLIKNLPFAHKTLEDADIVLAVFTAPMLYDYMFGFTQSAFDLYEYGRCDSCVREGRIRWTTHAITTDSVWYDAVKKQAVEKNISVEEALRGNAEYIIWMEDQDNH